MLLSFELCDPGPEMIRTSTVALSSSHPSHPGRELTPGMGLLAPASCTEAGVSLQLLEQVRLPAIEVVLTAIGLIRRATTGCITSLA